MFCLFSVLLDLLCVQGDEKRLDEPGVNGSGWMTPLKLRLIRHPGSWCNLEKRSRTHFGDTGPRKRYGKTKSGKNHITRRDFRACKLTNMVRSQKAKHEISTWEFSQVWLYHSDFAYVLLTRHSMTTHTEASCLFSQGLSSHPYMYASLRKTPLSLSHLFIVNPMLTSSIIPHKSMLTFNYPFPFVS